MGLDMYAFAVNKMDCTIIDNREVLLKESEENIVEQLAYWRKHNALHGWMEQLYRDKGGMEEFNCINLLLTKEDVNRLETDIDNRALIPVSGFFLCSTNYTEEDWEEVTRPDEAFIQLAKDALSEGYIVFYSSWW